MTMTGTVSPASPAPHLPDGLSVGVHARRSPRSGRRAGWDSARTLPA